MKNSMLLIGFLALVGCKDTGQANVDACNDWIDAMECGDTDWGTLVDCSIYEESDCDIADYFDCLTDGTTCDEETGVADMAGWTDCASKATCE